MWQACAALCPKDCTSVANLRMTWTALLLLLQLATAAAVVPTTDLSFNASRFDAVHSIVIAILSFCGALHLTLRNFDPPLSIAWGTFAINSPVFSMAGTKWTVPRQRLFWVLKLLSSSTLDVQLIVRSCFNTELSALEWNILYVYNWVCLEYICNQLV